jgi:predicted DCC family thiol-disulfide oxidoreductase YuxK
MPASAVDGFRSESAVISTPYSYRSDPAVPKFNDRNPIIIFDGKCVLCSAFAQFILRTDGSGHFRLLAAQSPLGTALYQHFRLDAVQYETYILLEAGCAYFRSEAAIRIFEELGLPWRCAVIGRIIPPTLRDKLYDFVAQHRLRWFGARDTCYVPPPSQADRFIS